MSETMLENTNSKMNKKQSLLLRTSHLDIKNRDLESDRRTQEFQIDKGLGVSGKKS